MKWKYIKQDKIWKKQLYHYWATITDEWGISSDERFNYKIDTYLYKCFSFKNGFWYQVKVPNFVANNKKLGTVLDLLFRYIYVDGGTPCYQRLEDELMNKNLWRQLGS